MVWVTSSETMSALPSTCSASVRTADSTSSLARSLLGLNSLLSSAAKSPASRVSVAPPCSACVSVAMCLLSVRVGGLGRRYQRLQQCGVVDGLGDQLLCAGLAVHVGAEVGELGARLQQLGHGGDLAG